MGVIVVWLRREHGLASAGAAVLAQGRAWTEVGVSANGHNPCKCISSLG
jgi:hypothetical protein